jgi:predicted  nucleic acid-binding Zn-ribbon protein
MDISELKCLRCGHRFFPRPRNGSLTLPQRCSKCGSCYWDTPRGEKRRETHDIPAPVQPA